jgi:hypothetical protein
MEKTKQKGNRETESKMEDGKYKSPKISKDEKTPERIEKSRLGSLSSCYTRTTKQKTGENRKLACAIAIRRFSSSSYSGC